MLEPQNLDEPKSGLIPHCAVSASAALKEWSATCRALGQGRQIMLLRKGGLLDEDGRFHLEYGTFFLIPTWLHQAEGLLKREDRDLLQEASAKAQPSHEVHLNLFATVARVWALDEANPALPGSLDHIWSQTYLDQRWSYKPGAPLLCVALRVWQLREPVAVTLRPQDRGCRSWVEWAEELEADARPVLEEADFQARVGHLGRQIG